MQKFNSYGFFLTKQQQKKELSYRLFQQKRAFHNKRVLSIVRECMKKISRPAFHTRKHTIRNL